MKVKLYKNFKKRKNSTLQPSGDFLEVDCTLKNGTSIVNPTIQLQLDFNSDYSNYNYCHIPDFGRFYYIRDLVWNNSIAEFVLVSDIMASFKSDIAGFTGLAVRSSKNADGNLPDNLLFPTDKITITEQIKTYVSILTIGYVIGFVGVGGAQFAYLTHTQLLKLCEQLNGVWANIFNEVSGINCCYRTLLTKEQVGAAASETTLTAGFGTAQFSFTGHEITILPHRFTLFNSFNLNKHSLSETYGNFLNSDKYRNFYVVNTSFGCIKLPTNSADIGDLIIKVVLSPDTGDSVIEFVGGGRILTTANANMYSAMPFVGSNINLANVASGAAGAFGGAGVAMATTNPATAVAAGIGAGVSLISGAVSTIPNGEIRGSSSSVATLDPLYYLYMIERGVNDNDNINRGRPYCRQYTASSGGYIEYERVNLSTNARADEKSEIESTMERGFYYE